MRLRCSAELQYELQIRGFETLGEVAREAGVSQQTVAAAIRGDRINMRTAVKLTTAVHRRHPRPELIALIGRPGANQQSGTARAVL